MGFKVGVGGMFWGRVIRISALLMGIAFLLPSNAQTGRPLSTKDSPQVERLIALVIGNADYAGSALKNPGNDAKSIGNALRGLGFEVFQYTNLPSKEMRRAITRFGELVNRDSTIVFYYAGHGLQAKGRNFLIPTDAEIKRETSIRSEAIDLEEVMEQFSVARTSVLILDACRNNPFERRFRAAYGTGLAQIDAPKGTLIAYATAPGKVALDGDEASENGVYTGALLSAMQLRGLRIEETFKRVRQNVSSATNDSQVPWESSSLTGDFCFGGCNVENPLSVELERVKRERETEFGLLKREKELLFSEKALAEKQRQILENELRERTSQQQALAEKLQLERNELATGQKKLLDDYERRLAAEVAARTRAEEEAKRLGSTSGVELSKLIKEKDLLVSEKALAEKQQQILANELREKNSLQQALSEKLQKEKDSIALERSKILQDHEKRLAEEVTARARAEDEAKRLGSSSNLELAKLKREKDLLANEKALAEKHRQILENELRERNSLQTSTAQKLQDERDRIETERQQILLDYEKRLSEEVAARMRAEGEAKRLAQSGQANNLKQGEEIGKLEQDIEQLRLEKEKLERIRKETGRNDRANSLEKPIFIPPMF